MYEVGQILAGKYRVDYQLGVGGMGVVLAATHMHLGTQVALKLLHEGMAQGQVVERFLREARASAQLRSENVCRVSDVGILDDGVPFIVMEMLVGQDLQSVLRSHGPLPVGIAADYILQACLGVAEAHAAGIVHRDLKPGNLMWTQRPDGTTLIKVLDFGVAKAPEGVSFSLTQTANIIGSPGYMSPEQLKSSKEVDARSDIWSLGIVLYELVSGKPPWNGESITELALRVAMDPMPPLDGLGGFEAVVARCLEKEPAKRYADLAALAAALAPFAASGPAAGGDLAAAVARVLKGSQAVMVAAPSTGVPQNPTTLRSANGVVTNPTGAGAARGGGGGRTWKLPAAIGLGVAAAVIAVVVATGGKGGASGEGGASGANAAAGGAEPATPVVMPASTPAKAAAAATAASGSMAGAGAATAGSGSGSGPASAPGSGSAADAATEPVAKKPTTPVHKQTKKKPVEDIGDSRK